MQDNSEVKVHLPFGSAATEEARHKRLNYLKYKGINLNTYQDSDISPIEVKSNIESYIGTMSIPVGLVGPLKYKDGDRIEEVFAPAATTEGALVASMNRGASAISLSGGFSAHVSKQLMLRAPIFCFENIEQAKVFENWVRENQKYLSVYIKNFSRHAELVEIKTTILGRDVETKFYYQTADASGQNMTTICTWQSCKWIKREFDKVSSFKIIEFVLEGNGASDKKASYDSILNGRGVDVIAECILDEEILNRKLKVKSEDILKWHGKSRPLISQNGMVGDNINIANSIGAIFTATGQDIACIHESAIGYLNFEKHKRGLYVTLRLPKLVIGTIGGGTSLPSQKENLNIMKCYGVGQIERYAKLIAGFAMGLELSTISAMVSGQFAIAHEKLGRNKPIKYLKQDKHLAKFVQNNVLLDQTHYIEFKDNFFDSNGIITELTSQNTEKFLGLSIWNMTTSKEQKLCLLKSKPTSKEMLNCMYILTGMIDPALTKFFDAYKETSDFAFGHTKEHIIYSLLSKENCENIPGIYGLYENDEREIYLILMEMLNSSKMRIFNSELESKTWTCLDVKNVFSQHYKNLSLLNKLNTKEEFKSADYSYLDFHQNSFQVLKHEYGDELDEYFNIHGKALKVIKENDITNSYQTLIHNDFNPRNIAITNENRFIAYDWELARVGLPQRDLVELLTFLIDNSEIKEGFQELCEFARTEFNNAFNENLTHEEWFLGMKQAFSWFVIDRVNLYLLGNKLTDYSFVNKLVKNIEIIGEQLEL